MTSTDHTTGLKAGIVVVPTEIDTVSTGHMTGLKADIAVVPTELEVEIAVSVGIAAAGPLGCSTYHPLQRIEDQHHGLELTQKHTGVFLEVADIVAAFADIPAVAVVLQIDIVGWLKEGHSETLACQNFHTVNDLVPFEMASLFGYSLSVAHWDRQMQAPVH